MKKTFYIWAACFVSLMVGIGTLGAWGFDDSTAKVIAVMLGLCSILSVAVYVYVSKRQISSKISTLHTNATSTNCSLGSYNAYFIKGEKFNTIMQGEPAVVEYDQSNIKIRTLPDNDPDEILSEPDFQETRCDFSRQNSKVLWVGESGRHKDYYTWLLIKDDVKAALISIYKGEPYTLNYSTESKRSATDFYYAVADLGYFTGIDERKRGLLSDVVGVVGSGVVGMSFLLNRNWLFGGMLLCVGVLILIQRLVAKKGPPERAFTSG